MQKFRNNISAILPNFISQDIPALDTTVSKAHSKIIGATIQSVVSGASWIEAEEKLKSSYANSAELVDKHYGLILEAFFLQAKIMLEPNMKTVHCNFVTENMANAFLSFLAFFFPIQEDVYPHQEVNIITLTSEQFHFCNIYYNSLCKDGLSSMIADHYLLKSLRSDEFDYSLRFIKGIIPGENGSRRQNLRPCNRRSHTVTHEKKVVERFSKTPMYSAKEKQGYSQIQSATLIDKRLRSSVFGVFKKRTDKLYGVMTHCDDALLNRLLTRDRGTVSRPFDVDLNNQDIAVFSETWRNDVGVYSPKNLEEFKKQNLDLREKIGGTNEVLARLRYNPYRTVVCICADTPEARWLAYDFAQELLQEFIRYAKANKIRVNPNFKIPILFYMPNNKTKQHRVFFYTESMRLKDIYHAKKINQDENLRRLRFLSLDYEFMLGVGDISVELLLKPGSNKDSCLAVEMIDSGYIRMLMRLLRPNSLANDLFDQLLRRKFIGLNDSIIVHLFEVDEFDIARKLMQETNSQFRYLCFRGNTYYTYLLAYGTPRQLHEVQRYYIPQSTLIRDTVIRGYWNALILYMKEYPSEEAKKILGNLLLLFYIHDQYYSQARFLIKLGADVSVCDERGVSLIVTSARFKSWRMVSLFSQKNTDSEDNAQYGEALIYALADKQMQIVSRLLSAGAKPPANPPVYLWKNAASIIEIIELVSRHDLKDRLLPFFKGCRIYWHEFETWFIECCAKKYYHCIEYVFAIGLDPQYIMMNNSNVISGLIIDEEFNIANKLHIASKKDIFILKYGEDLLVDHVIAAGKYSQFEYCGVERMLIYMAKNRNWDRLIHWLGAVKVTQGLDESILNKIVQALREQLSSWKNSDWVSLRELVEKYGQDFNPVLLRKVLVFALDKKQLLFAHYLLLKGAEWSVIKRSEFPILYAAQMGLWDIVRELAQEGIVENATVEYSNVLSLVISSQQTDISRMLLDRGIILIWECAGHFYPLPSEKLYQLIDIGTSLSPKEFNALYFQYLYQSLVEMLVLWPRVNSEILLHEGKSDTLGLGPLAVVMIKIGCFSELIKLLANDEVMAKAVIQSCKVRSFLSHDTSFISECICASAFELADQLLEATHTDKKSLRYGNKSLLDYLLENGNLSQWIYYGIGDIVYRMAQKREWGKALDVIGNNSALFNRQVLGKLLFEACNQNEILLAKLLLGKGADTTVLIDSVPMLFNLANALKWDLIDVFCDYDSDEKDDAQYGYAAVIAFRHKRVDLALKLLSRGALPVHLANFESSLFYAVKYELIDWIPRLIESEKSGCNSPKWVCSGAGVYLMPWRCALDHPGYNNIVFARDYAEAKSNTLVKSFFEPFSQLYYTPPLERDSNNDYLERVHTTQLFLETAVQEDAQFATQRVLKYAKHYKLISEDENNVLKVFEVIGSSCYWAIKNYPSTTKKVIYKTIRAVLERALEDNKEVMRQFGITFFARELPDKEYVARIVSRLVNDEVNSYEDYLSKVKSENETGCHSEETLDDGQSLIGQALVP